MQAIPQKIAVRTFIATSNSVTPSPARVIRAGTEPRSPIVTSVIGWSLMSPPCSSPMRAMKSPMPTAAASLITGGMPSTIAFRAPVTVSRTKTIPLQKTSPSAVGQGTPAPTQIP